MRAVQREVELVTLPPGAQPIVDLAERRGRNGSSGGAVAAKRHPYALTWAASPVALKLRSLPCELIALRVIRFGEALRAGESVDDILVLPRRYSDEAAAFLARLTAREDRPMVRTMDGTGAEQPRPVEPLGWDRLTLAPEVRRLLQDDFESFFNDQAWYEEMRIPLGCARHAHQPQADRLPAQVLRQAHRRWRSGAPLRASGGEQPVCGLA